MIERSDWFVKLTLLLSVTFVAATQLSALATAEGQLFPAAIFLLAAAVALRDQRTAHTAPLSAVMVLLLVALQIIALVRFAGHPVGDVSAHTALARAILLGALIAFLAAALWRHPTAARLRYAVLAPVVFAVVNLTAYVGGVRAPVDPNARYGQASMLGALHINFSRSEMPFTPGLNGGGMMAALALVIALLLLPQYQTRGRLALTAAAGMSIATILITDSRAALLVSFLALLLLWSLPRTARRALAIGAFLLPVMPMVVIWVLHQIAPFIENLSRNPGDAATATGRTQVWTAVIDKLLHPGLGAGLFEQVFGYGFYGQVASGVSYQYSYLFFGPAAPFRTAHSLVLQTLLDQGLVGLSVLVVATGLVLISAARRHQMDPSSCGLAIIGGVICVLLLGATEAVVNPATPYALAAFIVLCSAGVRTVWAPATAVAHDVNAYAGARHGAPS